jgi:hypothetical protein
MDLAAGATPAPDAGSSPAPQPPWPCDRSIAAGEGVTISNNGACPGLLPAAVTCAADLTICSGAGSMNGNSAAGATSDGRGSVVLSCHRADVRAPPLNFLFAPTRSGFLSKAGLGVDVRPLGDGFVVSEGSYNLPPPSYDFIAHDGTLRKGQPGGTLYASAIRAVIARLTNGEIVAESFTAAGELAATATLASFSAEPGSLMLGGAMNASGAALVIWQVYGGSKATARWLAPDGTPGAPFSIAGWTSNVPDAQALAGGSIAIAAEPPSGVSIRSWRGVIAPGETVERPAPSWLTARGGFLLLPEGKAMAFGTEVLAGDGTVCGTVDLGAPLVGIGLDGTAFAARNQRTFRIYPQLFR